MAEILRDILELILIRLDVIDLIQCKSVSKSWLSLISDPLFIKAHLHRSYLQDRNHKYIGHRRIALFQSPRLIPRDVHNESLDHLVCYLLGSSNGLVCISPTPTKFVVVNPITRAVRKLRNPQNSQIKPLCWGFGYDSKIDDYKVVLGFGKDEGFTSFQVLTLRSNTWKVIGEVNYTFISRTGIFCNGSLHWVAYIGSPQNNRKVILAFDLSEEKFKEVPQPDNERYRSEVASHSSMRLGIMEECLCVFRSEMVADNLWIMKDYTVMGSWRFVGQQADLKVEIIHCLKKLKHYIPYKRTLCDYWRTPQSREYLEQPIYVQTLVSPQVHGRLRRKRKATDTMRDSKIPK